MAIGRLYHSSGTVSGDLNDPTGGFRATLTDTATATFDLSHGDVRVNALGGGGGAPVGGSGTAPQVAVWTAGSTIGGYAGFTFINASNTLLVGATTAGAQLHVAGSTGSLIVERDTAGAGSEASFVLRRSAGSVASPSAIALDYEVGSMSFFGFNDDWRSGANISAWASTGWGASGADAPMDLWFRTSPDGSATPVNGMVLTSTQRLGIGKLANPPNAANAALVLARAHVFESDAATNTLTDIEYLDHFSTGAVAAGFGTMLHWRGSFTASGAVADMARFGARITQLKGVDLGETTLPWFAMAAGSFDESGSLLHGGLELKDGTNLAVSAAAGSRIRNYGGVLQGSQDTAAWAPFVYGSGAVNEIAYWSATHVITGSAAWQFDGTSIVALSAAFAGGVILEAVNTAAGVGNYGQLAAGSDSAASAMTAFSSTFTSANGNYVNGNSWSAYGTGGLSILVPNGDAAANLRIYVGGYAVDNLNGLFGPLGGFVVGSYTGYLAHNEADRFLYFPAMVVDPDGTPSTHGYTVPMTYNQDGDTLWVYNFVAAAWRHVAFSGTTNQPGMRWSGQYTGAAGAATNYFADTGAVVTAPLFTTAMRYPATAGTWAGLRVYVSANALASTLTVEVYKNGVATGVKVTFATTVTGWASDTTHSFTTNGTSDYFDLRADSTAAGVNQATLSATLARSP